MSIDVSEFVEAFTGPNRSNGRCDGLMVRRLLRSIYSQMPWAHAGKCRGDAKTMNGSPAQAKQLCEGCPVRAECLQWALDHEEFGVWGGTTEEERAGRQVA